MLLVRIHKQSIAHTSCVRHLYAIDREVSRSCFQAATPSLNQNVRSNLTGMSLPQPRVRTSVTYKCKIPARKHGFAHLKYKQALQP